MKEKIHKILKTQFELLFERQPSLMEDTWLNNTTNRLEPLINQEVAKRITERMPSEEEVDKKSYHACMMPDKNGEPEPDRGMYDAYIWGVNWLRSRLTQKTEGGEG